MLKVLTQGPGIEKSVLSSFTPSLKLCEDSNPILTDLCSQVMESEPEIQNQHQKFTAAGGSCSLEPHPTTISNSESFQNPQEELVGKII